MSARLEADVAIIGAGIAGLAAACRLREAGMSVVVLDKGLAGAGASGVNFGGVRQQGRALAQLPMARRARALWDGLSQRLGVDIEFEATGHLKLARSEADMAELERYAEAAKPHGLELELLGANALHAAHPWLGAEVIGGSLCAEDGQANPRLVGPAFARLARALGADIREHTKVTGAAWTGALFDIAAEGLGVTARHLVNSSGAFGGTAGSWFGEPFPVTPMLPNMLVSEPLPFTITRSIGVVGGDVYIRQVKRGNVIFGGGRGMGDAEGPNVRAVTEVSRRASGKTLGVVPALRHAHIIRSWTGVDGETPDGLPIVGMSATTPNLVHAVAFNGHGFQLAPAVGDIIAELVLSGETDTPLDAFKAARF